MATYTFLNSYFLSGGLGHHLFLQMSRWALHIGDCLAALLRICRLGPPPCGPSGELRPNLQAFLKNGVLTDAWDPCELPFLLRGEWTLCRAFMPPSSFSVTP